MSARVEFRLGSIFDEECNLLVIPSSARGDVSPHVQEELRKAGLQFPIDMPLGMLRVFKSENPRYGVVAYAAGVAGQGAHSLIVEEIGRKIGRICHGMVGAKISAPLLGAGSGNLNPQESASALIGGFRETAPNSAVLVISIRKPAVLKALATRLAAADAENGIERAQLSLAVAGPVASAKRLGRAAPKQVKSTDHFLTPDIMRHLLERAGAHGQPPAEPVRAAASSSAAKRTCVFISYSHADREWLERLRKHLKPLQREGIEVWDDTRLKAGMQWREEIRETMAKTRVAILLISADFMSSDFINTDELPPLLHAAADDGATILPVIVSPSRFDRTESLSCFQAVNDPSKPLVQMRRANREKVLDQVARAVEDALKQ